MNLLRLPCGSLRVVTLRAGASYCSVRGGRAPTGAFAGMLSFGILFGCYQFSCCLDFYIDLGKRYLRFIDLLSLGYIFENRFMSFYIP